MHISCLKYQRPYKWGLLFWMSVVSPASRFAYIEVVSPTQPSRFAYIKVVSPTLIKHYKFKYFVKMDEHHFLQLAEESYLTVFPVKFRDITAFN